MLYSETKYVVETKPEFLYHKSHQLAEYLLNRMNPPTVILFGAVQTKKHNY